jgi:ribonuclease R
MSRKNSNKKKNKSVSGENLHKGTLDITRSGVGYVIVQGQENDILIRPNDFNTAMHGDKVRVRITGDKGRGGRMQGEVVEVLERKQTEFLGRIQLNKNFAFFIAETESQCRTSIFRKML